jgi:ABC-type polysaccharide transport system permease subunit
LINISLILIVLLTTVLCLQATKKPTSNTSATTAKVACKVILKLRETRILIKKHRYTTLKFKITRSSIKVFILRIVSGFLLDIIFILGISLILFIKSIRIFSIMVCLPYDLSYFYLLFLGIAKTTGRIKELYYRITKQDIRWVIKYCNIYAITVLLAAKTKVIPIITKILFERIQVDLMDSNINSYLSRFLRI